MGTYVGPLPGGEGNESENSRFIDKHLVKIDAHGASERANQKAALAIPGPPAIDFIDPDYLLPCTDRRAYPHRENSLYYVVECVFSKPPGSERDVEDPDNPLADPPTIQMDDEEIDEIIWGDLNSDRTHVEPLMTTAKEVINPPYTRKVHRAVWTLTKNFATSYDVGALMDGYQDVINSDTWLGRAAKTWLCLPPKASHEKRSGVNYIEVQLKIKFKPETYDLFVPDIGSYYLEGLQKIHFKSDTGESIQGFLDGSTGAKSGDGEPHYQAPRQIYMSAAFSGTGFPSTFSSYRLIK